MGRPRSNFDDLSYAEIAEKHMASETSRHGKKQHKAYSAEVRNEEVTTARLRQLIEQSGYRCMLSGVKLDPDEASLDHSIPLSKGGEHNMSNVQIVHSAVNRMKGTMDKAEFIEWCRKIAAWNG